MDPDLPQPEALRYTVALVEDEPVLREEMAFQLRHMGFVVQAFADSHALYRYLATRPSTVLVLDIGLPDEDGLSVCRHLRAHSADVGIVMVTALGQRDERLAGLAAGADAYLVKPVDIDELALVLRRLMLRDPQGPGSTPAPVSALSAAPAARWQLSDDGLSLIAPHGERVSLTLNECQLMAALTSKTGSPCGTAELCRALGLQPEEWDRHRVDVIISRLRAKVERQTGQSLPLRTLRGLGYQWMPTEQRTRPLAG